MNDESKKIAIKRISTKEIADHRDHLIGLVGLIEAVVAAYTYEGTLSIGALRYLAALADSLASQCDLWVGPDADTAG